MRIQAEPRLIDAGDMPAATYGQQALAQAELITDMASINPAPETPTEMHRHLLDKAHHAAVTASENAYEACDWLRLLDPTTADKYRASATRLFEMSEHLSVLLEES